MYGSVYGFCIFLKLFFVVICNLLNNYRKNKLYYINELFWLRIKVDV